MNKINFSSPVVKERIKFCILWLIIAVGLYLVRPVLLPFLLASFLAYLLNPLVGWISKISIKNRKLPRGVSVFIIYLLGALVLSLLTTFFTPRLYVEIARFAKETASFAYKIDEGMLNNLASDVEHFFRQYDLPLEIVNNGKADMCLEIPSNKAHLISIDLVNASHDAVDNVINYAKYRIKDIIGGAQVFFTQLVSSAFNILLILMIAAFILADLGRIKKFVFNLVPLHDKKYFDHFLTRVDIRLSGVVRGQIIICFINAVLTLIGLLILKVNFAFTLAVFAGIFSLVPVFGSIISTIPIFLVALATSPLVAFLALLWIVVIHAIEAYLLNPKILGDSAKIHPVLIVLALMAGKHFYGIIGALLSVPIMSILITIYLSILSKIKENY